ncbi:MAG: LysR family transcriptional regulator [Sandaracinaceae bacterium]|nr:LysR family transcriptional regulator [Sandaracinaceae bacterium]
MVRWDDLAILLAVHRGGSLAAAAESLRIDASTVSRRLRAAERELGSRLFDRTPDGLVPTDLLLRLLPHAEQAEAAALAVEAEAAGEEIAAVGRVRVALADAFAAYLVAPALPAFLDARPGLTLDLLVGTELVDLSRREADIAVRFVRPTRGDLVAKRIAASGLYGGFVSRGYAATHDLAPSKLHWIGWGESKAHLPEAQLYRRLVGRPPRLECDNLIVQIEAARAGAGAILMPAAFGGFEEEIVRLEAPPPLELDMDVWLVAHRAIRHVPRVRVVWDWLESLVGPPAEP